MEIEYSFGCMVISDTPYLTETDQAHFYHLDMRTRVALVSLEETKGGFDAELSSIDDELRSIRYSLSEVARLQNLLKTSKGNS